MKVFFPMLCLMSVVLAEPPVGDGYPAARSSADHHHGDHHDHLNADQRSLSQEYGPPSASANSAGYSSYNSRTALSSRRYSPPTARVSFSQRFSSAGSRNKDLAAALKSLSQGYATPETRGISQEYGIPEARSLSQEYGVPSVSARTLSTEYGAPDARSTPSQEYGAPVIVAARSNQPNSQGSNFRSSQGKSQGFSALPRSQLKEDTYAHAHTSSLARSIEEQGYDGKFNSRSVPSSTYGVPSSRTLSTSYGAPSARDSDAYSQGHTSISQSYSIPSQQDLSETYGAPNARSLSQEYGVPSSQNLKTSAQASYASSRSPPSSTYLPAGRSSMPSEQYGVPEQRDGDGQGYDYTKARAINELLNQFPKESTRAEPGEPANYDFAYQIEDNEFGSDFGHSESRLEDRAEGSYFVVLPDGTKQTVEYEADEGGFKPRISVEAVGGYDDNAADVTRTASGPY